MSFSGTKGFLIKPKPGVQINPLHPLSKGLVGYWLFNEGAGSLANDISGNGNHGTLTGMSPNVQGSGWGSSRAGGGLVFDGTDDRIIVSDSSSLDITSAITVSVWAYLDSSFSDDYPKVISKGNPEVYQIYYNTYGPLEGYSAGVTVGSTNYDVHSLNTTKDTWMHFTLTYDGETVEFFIDGISVGTNTAPSGNIDTNNADVIIGNRLADARHWKGKIDDVHIYNRVLSSDEIKQLYYNQFCNLLQVPIRRYSVAAPPVGAVMNQFQGSNIGADLYDGAIIA